MKSWKGRLKSVARSWARSTCSSPSTSRRVRSPGSSEGEEDGLMVPLQVDVERVAAAAVGLGDEGRALRLAEAGEQRIGGVGLRLVAEVDPGGDAVQEPAREHRDGDVGRLAGSRPARP